jgi:glutathione S-transferase
MQFVDFEAARTHDGPVMLIAALLPSPWSEAAKGFFHVKKIDVALVRYRSSDKELAAWSGAENVPVLLCKGEPRRTNWAEILTFAEARGAGPSIVPENDADRIRLFGVAHEIAGEWGLGYCSRLVMIHGSFVTDGKEGFPLNAAKYLATKYGYAESAVSTAKTRIGRVLELLHRMVEKSRAEGRTYLLGERLSALDIYLATFLTPILGVTEQECPGMLPQIHAAFAYLKKEVGSRVTDALVAHRASIFERHLVMPIEI